MINFTFLYAILTVIKDLILEKYTKAAIKFFTQSLIFNFESTAMI